MSGPIRGSIEHYVNGTGLGTGSMQSMFVSCYNFLNNNTGTLGIQRIAYNTGSQGTGMAQFRGMNYYNQPAPAGENAWACFRFLSASVPFDVLIQWTGATAFGTAPGSPAKVDNATTTYMLGVSACQRIDGATAWGGTVLNDGNDVKGAVVWNTGSTYAAHYPRSNDPVRGGGTGLLKQNMMGIALQSAATYRAHFIADYDNFVILTDLAADNTYLTFMLGIYTPMSGLNVEIPYFAFCDSVYAYPDPATTYGPLAGGVRGGGICYPSASVSGTCVLGCDYVSTYFTRGSTTYQPNKAWPVPRWDESPFWVGIAETPNQVGLCGQHGDFMRTVYNIATHDTNGDGSRAVFGDTTVATYKITVPWDTATVPGTGVTREGVQFGIGA